MTEQELTAIEGLLKAENKRWNLENNLSGDISYIHEFFTRRCKDDKVSKEYQEMLDYYSIDDESQLNYYFLMVLLIDQFNSINKENYSYNFEIAEKMFCYTEVEKWEWQHYWKEYDFAEITPVSNHIQETILNEVKEIYSE